MDLPLKMSRIRLFSFLAALVILRVVIGFHFFKEGADKIRQGDFSAEPFLSAAAGPLAPYHRSLLSDPDGKIRLGVVESGNEADGIYVALDPELTLALWGDFLDRAKRYYQWSAGDWDRAQSLYRAYRNHLTQWLNDHRDEIVAHFQTSGRSQGFDRDGDQRIRVAEQVESLGGQVAQIRDERRGNLARWIREIEGLWDAYELEINAWGATTLAAASAPPRNSLSLHRPFRQPYSRLNVTNAVVPWFDLTVGALLIVGLLTPWAALAGAVFLVAVISTQPPWIPGSASTQYQIVECVALLVIACSASGRIAGLDFFWSAWRHNRKLRQMAASTANSPVT